MNWVCVQKLSKNFKKQQHTISDEETKGPTLSYQNMLGKTNFTRRGTIQNGPLAGVIL